MEKAIYDSTYKRRQRHSIQSVPSSSTTRVSKLPIRNQECLWIMKYLIGRPYLLFKSAVRSEKSLQLYRQNLWHLCDFIGMSTEEIIPKYRGSNGKSTMKLQQMVEDYVLLLQTKIRNGELLPLWSNYDTSYKIAM